MKKRNPFFVLLLIISSMTFIGCGGNSPSDEKLVTIWVPQRIVKNEFGTYTIKEGYWITKDSKANITRYTTNSKNNNLTNNTK